MPKLPNIPMRRYLSEQEFLNLLLATKAYSHGASRGSVGKSHLDWFEESGLLPPKIRLYWPDEVARRFRAERYQQRGSMVQPLEPDGPRWDAAVELYHHLERYSFYKPYDPIEHPFDSKTNDVLQFLEYPDGSEFTAREDRRLDISRVGNEPLFSSDNIQDFYSSWQILIGIEAADMGVHIRVNMAAPNAFSKVYEQITNGQSIKGANSISTDNGINRLIAFSSALDAIVFAEEEGDCAMVRTVKGKGMRFVFEDDEYAAIEETRKLCAINARKKFAVEAEQLYQLALFLAEKTTGWDREGRPLISHVYKQFLAGAVRMLERTERIDFHEISKRVGRSNSGIKETLKQIWPDWNKQQKERVIRTLKGQLPTGGPGKVSDDELNSFASFLIREHQHGFLLHLEAFEHHAFSGNNAAMPSMANHLQGMAVSVEHVVRAMGDEEHTMYTKSKKRTQLHEVFMKAWGDNKEVSTLLKSINQRTRSSSEWQAEIEKCSGSSEVKQVVTDLTLAQRIRGAVHYALPEENQLGKERIFVALMRAAIMTHAHLNRSRATES